MKLRFLSLVAVMALLLSCGSSRTSTSENYAYGVPTSIHTNFITQYPTATNIAWSSYNPQVVPVDWELVGWNPLDENDYVVRFDLNNDAYYAYYDRNGNWIGSVYAVKDYATLPTAVSSLLATQFAGYTIEKIQTETWKDRLAYEIKLNNQNNKVKLLVDANGTIIKQKLKD